MAIWISGKQFFFLNLLENNLFNFLFSNHRLQQITMTMNYTAVDSPDNTIKMVENVASAEILLMSQDQDLTNSVESMDKELSLENIIQDLKYL